MSETKKDENQQKIEIKKVDKYTFYKTNIITSLHTIIFLTLEDIEDKEIPLIVQLSRISEIILSFHYDVDLNKQKKESYVSHWSNVFNFITNEASYSNLHGTIDSVNRIRDMYRNPAQHYYETKKPVSSEMKEAYKNIFEIISSRTPDICYSTMKKLFNENKNDYLAYSLLYCKIYELSSVMDKLLKTYKEEIIKNYWKKSFNKKDLEDVFSSSLFNKHFMAVKYIKEYNSNILHTDNILSFIKENCTNNKEHKDKLFL